MYKYFVLSALMVIACIGCKEAAEPGASQSKASNQAPVVNVDSEDEVMNAAIARARRTVDTFVSVLGKPGVGQESFSVKMPLSEDGVTEHIWVVDVAYRDNIFSGKLGNEPEDLPSHHLGEQISINKNEISDWMFLDQGEIVGGFTIKALMGSVDPATRSAMERNMRFRDDQPE